MPQSLGKGKVPFGVDDVAEAIRQEALIFK